MPKHISCSSKHTNSHTKKLCHTIVNIQRSIDWRKKIMSGPITFNMINVNGQESLGGVFVGDTAASNWQVQQKINQNQGMNFAAFGASIPVGGNFNYINDPDAIENPQNGAVDTAPSNVV